jgi:hypothetical protein
MSPSRLSVITGSTSARERPNTTRPAVGNGQIVSKHKLQMFGHRQLRRWVRALATIRSELRTRGGANSRVGRPPSQLANWTGGYIGQPISPSRVSLARRVNCCVAVVVIDMCHRSRADRRCYTSRMATTVTIANRKGGICRENRHQYGTLACSDGLPRGTSGRGSSERALGHS